MATPNPWLLAADNSPALLPLLHEKPALASAQDEHGYSLVHAAASYNHLDLLRTLVKEFKVKVDIEDEDGETALYFVETVEAAKVLVEELEANVAHTNGEGFTAREKIDSGAEFPDVLRYLAGVESSRLDEGAKSTVDAVMPEAIPPPPEGMSLTVGTMDQSEDVPADADPEFRRRIEELAQRDDFHTPEGQAELRKLVEDAVLGQDLGDGRNVRQKQA